METAIVTGVAQTTNSVIKILSEVPAERFNQIPFPGSWTAGQYGEHILKNSGWILKMITGDTRHSQRDPSPKVNHIERVFPDLNNKMKSPDFIEPSAGPQNKISFIDSLDHTLAWVDREAQANDMSSICKDGELPGFGELTRQE
jgi:hypothetical protein